MGSSEQRSSSILLRVPDKSFRSSNNVSVEEYLEFEGGSPGEMGGSLRLSEGMSKDSAGPLSARISGDRSGVSRVTAAGDYDELKRKYKREQKEGAREREQLAATNRQLRQDFELKSEEYLGKMRQKK